MTDGYKAAVKFVILAIARGEDSISMRELRRQVVGAGVSPAAFNSALYELQQSGGVEMSVTPSRARAVSAVGAAA